MGRHKSYTANGFASAVKKYFDSITRTVQSNIIANNGKTYTETVFLRPPSLTDLELELKITRQTFSRYAKGDVENITENEREIYMETAENAKLQIENFLRREVVTRTKGVEGVKFILENDFSCKERHEIGMDSATRNAMVASSMTLEEKERELRKLKEDILKDGKMEGIKE